MIYNKQFLCEHGGLHPMIARNRKCIPCNFYNHMKETFIKKWKYKSLLGLDSSEDTPDFTNHEISKINMRRNIFIIDLWHGMSKNIELLKELHILVRALNKFTRYLEKKYFVFAKKS